MDLATLPEIPCAISSAHCAVVDYSDISNWPGKLLIAYAEPHNVLRARAMMEAWEIPVYVPYRQEIQRKNGIRRLKTMPLFPGHLFPCVTDEKQVPLHKSDWGVSGIRRVSDSMQAQFKRELSAVNEALKIDPLCVVRPQLKKGRMVEITQGCYRGQIGIVERLDEKKMTLTLNVETLGRSVEVSLDWNAAEAV